MRDFQGYSLIEVGVCMKKALLVGNGFTSNLILDYKNTPMMKAFYDRRPNLKDKVEDEFSFFRNLSFENNDLYSISETLFCGDSVLGGENTFPSSDGIHVKDGCKNWVIDKLACKGFQNPNKTFEEYFINYGLIYSINSDEMIGIESYLKVIHMF